jgi:hypothetical protein
LRRRLRDVLACIHILFIRRFQKMPVYSEISTVFLYFKRSMVGIRGYDRFSTDLTWWFYLLRACTDFKLMIFHFLITIYNHISLVVLSGIIGTSTISNFYVFTSLYGRILEGIFIFSFPTLGFLDSLWLIRLVFYTRFLFLVSTLD